MNKSLTSFIEELTGESHLQVEDDLGGGFVRLRRAEAERRQAQHDIRCTEDIVIELLRNARDAGARNIFLAVSREDMRRRICIIDDGEGIPENMHELIFEPRVTSKLETMHKDAWGVHGRGMALFSISANTERAQVLDSSPSKGAAFLIEYQLDSLTEKTDQSTTPMFSIDENGETVVRGPRNINRIVAEFAFAHKNICNVFYGSITDIVASLYLYGQTTLSKSIRAFCEHPEDLPLIKRLCTAGDPKTLVKLSASIGLFLSERSARRILDGEIRALSSMTERITLKKPSNSNGSSLEPATIKKLLKKDERGLKVHEDDLKEFEEKINQAFEELAKNYFLETKLSPEIRIHSDALHIRIPLSKLL